MHLILKWLMFYCYKGKNAGGSPTILLDPKTHKIIGVFFM